MKVESRSQPEFFNVNGDPTSRLHEGAIGDANHQLLSDLAQFLLYSCHVRNGMVVHNSLFAAS